MLCNQSQNPGSENSSDGTAFHVRWKIERTNWLGVARLGEWKGDVDAEAKSHAGSH